MKFTTSLFCEFDKYAAESYCAIHGVDSTLNIGDITKVDEKFVPDFNTMFGGSPCFPAGTKVFTGCGYKNIESVVCGDNVLTHNNRFMPVVRIGGKKNREIWAIHAKGFLETRCTDYHPFYVRRTKDDPPEKIRLKDIEAGQYVGHIINKQSENKHNLSDEDCWILGAYAAINADLGQAALIKSIPNFILDLPKVKLHRFFGGYMSKRGCKIEDKYQTMTCSAELAMGLTAIVQKLYNVGCDIYYDERPSAVEAGAKTPSRCGVYTVEYSLEDRDHLWFSDGDFIWYPVEKIYKTGAIENVYNIEVQDDHTYTANNIVCFNCQDFSIAGKQKGAEWTCKVCGHVYNPLEAHYKHRDKCPSCGSTEIEKTRSSLLVEWLRFLREKKPRFAIYENVKNIVGSRFRPTFNLFVKELEDYGYNVYWQVLNAKHYGIPQNRERVYCVIVRKDLDNGKFKFPEPIPLKHTLADMLETDVDEKYYLSDEKVAAMITPQRISKTIRAGGRNSTDKKHQWDLVAENIRSPIKQ